MASANMDLVRSIYAAWERGDFRSTQWAHPEIEFVIADLVFDRNSGRGKSSGMEIGQTRAEGAQLFRVAEGKVTRLVSYWDRENALADLGLTPDTGS